VTAIAAGETGQRRHDHRAAFRQLVEHGHPARQPTEAGEKAEFRALPLRQTRVEKPLTSMVNV
jgi:hypothetical protein